MDPLLFSYLSLQYESKAEQEYITGLISQFEVARDTGSYHLALFAYHLVFICYFYQTLHKLKIWFPDKHHGAMVSFTKERRDKFRGATNPTDYAHNENSESSLFELLNIFCECNEVVVACKNLVKYRNTRLGHVNYLLVSEEDFEKKIDEYDKVALKIHKLTHLELSKVFDEYFESIDSEIGQAKDIMEIGLISPNRLGHKDLELLAVECLRLSGQEKEETLKILKNDFDIRVELAE